MQFSPIRLILLLILASLTACAPQRAPVPLGTLPESRPVTVTEEQYGQTVLEEITKRYELDYNDPRFAQINTIVDRLTTAAGAANDPWHVYLLKAPDVQNAAATRGNHIFVWSGILDSVQSDDELAAVLGHEIAHVLARHTDPDPQEQLRKILIEVGALAAGVAVTATSKNPNLGQNLGDLTAALTKEVGSGLLVYPYSRELELEADHIGMVLMAKAGYDPHAAIAFWERAQQDPNIGSSMRFFSTHPPAKERLTNLKKALPYALDAEKNGPVRGSTGQSIDSQRTTAAPGESTTTWWQITTAGTKLYRAPRTSALALGEFRAGARVEVSDAVDGWLEVLSPDRGWIQQKHARRTQ